MCIVHRASAPHVAWCIHARLEGVLNSVPPRGGRVTVPGPWWLVTTLNRRPPSGTFRKPTSHPRRWRTSRPASRGSTGSAVWRCERPVVRTKLTRSRSQRRRMWRNEKSCKCADSGTLAARPLTRPCFHSLPGWERRRRRRLLNQSLSGSGVDSSPSQPTKGRTTNRSTRSKLN